ncbi:11598_t:CDS:2, partial [Entrophospora sp. SA101]
MFSLIRRSTNSNDIKLLQQIVANNEGYWNCDKMAKQLKEKAIPIFEAITNHGAYASDALLVNKMNLNPGGIQPKMRTTTMRDGTIQEMVFEDGTPK